MRVDNLNICVKQRVLNIAPFNETMLGVYCDGYSFAADLIAGVKPENLTNS